MTTAEQPVERDAAQTPAQWAVRWFALVFVAGLCALVPLVHVLWHVVLGHDEPLLRTRSQQQAPAATAENVLSGDWMQQKEIELREASPVVWWLRGSWNELRYRAGIPQSRGVHFGRDDWFFIRNSVEPDNAAFERATDKRRAFLAGVRDLVRQNGAELLMVVIPDKARVYADLAFADGELPPEKRDNYRRILDEFAELGIPAVDMATPLRAARAAERARGDTRDLYYARDTHWLPGGALVGMGAAAAEIERRFGERLGPRVAAEVTGPRVLYAVGDLTDMLGLLTTVQPDAWTDQRTVALSLLSDALIERREIYGSRLLTPAGPVPMNGDDPDAEVLLIGTSFSQANGSAALAFHLGRPVRGVIIRGAQGMLPLRAALDELRSGTRAKVVVWELVERGMFQGAWLDPELP